MTSELHAGVQRSTSPQLCPLLRRCPGVYGRGCGGTLQLVRYADGAFCFWSCSAYECAYRDFLPPRRLTPELCITLAVRPRGAVQVAAMPGAEDAVRCCGGVAAVLRAAGVDMQQDSGSTLEPPASREQAGGSRGGGGSSGGDDDGGGNAATASVPSAAAGEVPPPEAAPAVVPTPGPLDPVLFPLAQYERLSSHLLQFSRRHGICLLASAGTIPPTTLLSARCPMAML